MATDSNDKANKQPPNPSTVIATKDGKEVKVVKVAPYPISGKFETTEGKPPLEFLIQRVEEFGFMFRSTGHFYRVGEEYTCDFEIPVSKARVHEKIKVVKTVESAEAYVPNGNKVKVMTVEVHFKTLLNDSTKPIREFIRKIGQKPPGKPGQPPPQAK